MASANPADATNCYGANEEGDSDAYENAQPAYLRIDPSVELGIVVDSLESITAEFGIPVAVVAYSSPTATSVN